MRYDAIVIGLGGMGSAVAAHAAARGMRTLGLEQFAPAHALGSSHGLTRIIRQAYFESPEYVPLLLRAYALWDALEARTRMQLRAPIGGLFVGRPEATAVAGTIASARQWGLTHDVYDATGIRSRWPMFHPLDDEIGVYEAIAGAVFPEAAVRAHLEVAGAEGAELRFDTVVAGWDAGDDGVRVTLDDGTTIDGERLAICAGPWFAKIAPDLGLPLVVERNVQFWFAPVERGGLLPHMMPIFGLERPGQRLFYGFPDFGNGVKVAYHGSGVVANPDALDREVQIEEIGTIRRALESFLPAANGTFMRAAACMYTNTPDEHFAIGPHPRQPRVVVAGGFSGHGFKFAPVVGEIVAALLAQDDPGFGLAAFAPERFAAQTA